MRRGRKDGLTFGLSDWEDGGAISREGEAVHGAVQGRPGVHFRTPCARSLYSSPNGFKFYFKMVLKGLL